MADVVKYIKFKTSLEGTAPTDLSIQTTKLKFDIEQLEKSIRLLTEGYGDQAFEIPKLRDQMSAWQNEITTKKAALAGLTSTLDKSTLSLKGSSMGMRRKQRERNCMNRVRKLSLIGMLASLMLLSALSAGCKTITLYPITDKDIRIEENGDVCMSPFYMEEVLKAKLKVNK